jgi:hypothetical protein
MCFWNNHHQVHANTKGYKAKELILLVFGSVRTKERDQDIQNRLKSPMPGGDYIMHVIN